MIEENTKDEVCKCSFCKNNHDFIIPREIIEALKEERLVIFAGAGVSTESKNVFIHTLYEEVFQKLSLESQTNLSFSQLMTKFCEHTDGRAKLLQMIKQRFDYVRSFLLRILFSGIVLGGRSLRYMDR